MNAVNFKPVAGHAVLVEFASEISDAVAEQVVQLDRAIQDAGITGLRETTPALVNLLVLFDPLKTDHRTVITSIEALLPLPEAAKTTPRTHEIEVCYDETLAPDLHAVSAATGLDDETLIATHLAGTYRVGMYGFAPGFAYLAGVPPMAQVPRKPTPVRDVPAGSVMIAGPQCIVTTVKMPTGWSIIGRSPTQIMTGKTDRPFLFDVGDRVSFKRITRAAYERALV
ncbi:MAG: allophanate hydrolase subunit 1 [Pseudomonadota bacterium]